MIRLLGQFQKLVKQTPQIYEFSEYFSKRDQSEIVLYMQKRLTNKRYLTLKTKWQDDLKRKQQKRERQTEINNQRSKVEEQQSKLVIHNPREEVQIPCDPDRVFAVIELAGKQFKVAKDDIVISEYIEGLDINEQLEIKKVLLVGTQQYTSIGRPFVDTARVTIIMYNVIYSGYCYSRIINIDREGDNIEKVKEKEVQKIDGQTQAFTYLLTKGHRQNVTVFRINDIIHDVAERELARAVSLI